MENRKWVYAGRSIRNAVVHAKTLDDYLLESIMIMEQMENWDREVTQFFKSAIETRGQLHDLLRYANSLIETKELVTAGGDDHEGGV